LPEIGFDFVSLESDSKRRFLKMGDETGILITDVAPLGVLHQKILRGDVVTSIDGHDVTNEGNVPLTVGGQKVFVSADALTTSKPKGETTTFRVLRKGNIVEVEAQLGPIPPLAPRFHGFDCVPDYVIVGGIVFARGTVPLFGSWQRFDKFKQDMEHEIVVLISIFKHDVNLGYGRGQHPVVKSVNGQDVRSLASFARLVGETIRAKEEFLCITKKKPADEEVLEEPDIVLEVARLRAADEEICRANQIAAIASEAMLSHYFGGEQPTDAAPSVAADGKFIDGLSGLLATRS